LVQKQWGDKVHYFLELQLSWIWVIGLPIQTSRNPVEVPKAATLFQKSIIFPPKLPETPSKKEKGKNPLVKLNVKNANCLYFLLINYLTIKNCRKKEKSRKIQLREFPGVCNFPLC
jgi:hypothetical protein